MPKEPSHGRGIALNQIVASLPIDVSNAAKMRIISMIDLTNDPSIRLRVVHCPAVHRIINVARGGHDCHRAVQSHTLNRLCRKAFAAIASRFAVRRKSTI